VDYLGTLEKKEGRKKPLYTPALEEEGKEI